MSALLPCPFCGGAGHIIPDQGNQYRSNVLYRPQCDRCGGGLGGFDTSVFAIAAWNTRDPSASEADASDEEDTLFVIRTAQQRRGGWEADIEDFRAALLARGLRVVRI